MASRLEAAQKRTEALEAKYARAKEVYDGSYVLLKTLTEEGTAFFLGAEGIVGSELNLGLQAKLDDAAGLFILSAEGKRLAELTGEAAEKLLAHQANGWHISSFLSATFFKAADKSASAEIAFLCWAPLPDEQEKALATFAHNIAGRLASGDRAGLYLSQEHFIQVLESDGAWYLTREDKREPLEKGTVIYKNRRTGIERVTEYALKHRVGCNILAVIFWALLAVGLLAVFFVLVF